MGYLLACFCCCHNDDINNKLIALDLSSGESLWDPLDLPAGSLSAPAVGNNMVFVGCQNLWGSSLFAYDIDTGEEVWNASVGVIGRASPVYADGKIFVLSREKDNFTSLGTNKVVSVDAKTGEEMWNISIGEVKFSSLINILRGLNLYQMLLNFAPMTSPAYYDDTLYVLSQNGNLLALNPDNGKTKWSYDLNKDAPYSYIIPAGAHSLCEKYPPASSSPLNFPDNRSARMYIWNLASFNLPKILLNFDSVNMESPS